MSRYRWVVLFASFYAFVAFAFNYQLIPPMMNVLIQEFDVSHAQAGLLMSLVMFPGIFLALPGGVLVDRYGVRTIGFVSTLMVAFGSFITGISGFFNSALIGRALLGVGGAFVSTAMPAVIPQWFPPRELGKAMGMYGINMPLGSSIAFISASILMYSHGWRYSIYIGTAIALMSVLFFPLLIREGPYKRMRGNRTMLNTALRNSEIWRLGLIWLLFNASALSFITWGPKIFLSFKGMKPFDASLLTSTLMIAAIFCVPLFGWLSDRLGRRKPMMVIGLIVMTLSLIAIAYASEASLIASTIALGVSAALTPPMVMALPTEILGPDQAGVGYGIVATCLNAGISVAPVLIGLIIDMTNSPTLSFLGMALFSALGATLAYTLRSR